MRRFAFVVAIASTAIVFGGRDAAAQDLSSFLDNSPGPLTASHSPYDNSDGCEQCHVLGGGATGKRCLDCHENLAKLIKKKRGLHQTVKDQPCSKCHTEHKGRTAQITTWKHVGSQRRFDHKKTGFVLAGVHKDIPCTKCHLKKLRSQRTSYIGLSNTCYGCHGNTHAFTSKDLRGKCETCHPKNGGSANKMKAADLPFDHEKRGGLALVGKHGEAECTKCHKGAKMSLKRKRQCRNCHAKKSPHGRTFKKSKCDDCHKISEWKEVSFSHEKTKFPLRAKHARANCSKCHKTLKRNPKRTCEGCHKRTHRKRFAKQKCRSCHGLGGTNRIKRFNHEKRAEWALTGKHKSLGCRTCHRGKRPWKFEKFESGDACLGCHAHEKAHNGEFDDKQCQNCHKEGGSKDLAFDHSKDTKFPLTGLHLELEARGECEKCHPDQVYRTGKFECAQCHDDSHEGQLGDRCDRCHTTAVKFKELEFDHDRLSSFELVGLHEKVECEKCHPSRKYKTGKAKCFDCHQEDDPHGEVLGDDCERCHVPEKGAPKFDHDIMTSFTLLGAHAATNCARCHQPKPEIDLVVGWTDNVEPVKLDLHFPRMGAVCADCHFDVHEGRYGKNCGSCHNASSFGKVRPAHDTGAFRLLGRHNEIACGRCHTNNRLLTGVGPSCLECHVTDDAHNGVLGPACGDCHQQFGWIPARFNHGVTGFILRGAHRTAQCRDCHGVGMYAGLSQDCQDCHLGDAVRPTEPKHGPEMTECRTCHVEIAFSPARPYHPWHPLLGSHKTARCSSCHLGGVYVGTPKDCILCHEVDYINPRNDPNHVTEAFSTDCTECHSQVTFKGAVAPNR